MKIVNVRISPVLEEELRQISRNRYPEEACAIIFGELIEDSKRELRITKIIELNNIVHSEIEFRWDEMEFYEHYMKQAKQGFSLVGVFHSHPNHPYISKYDEDVILNTGKLYPDLVWVVFGNKSNTFRAFLLVSLNEIKEIPINSRHN